MTSSIHSLCGLPTLLCPPIIPKTNKLDLVTVNHSARLAISSVLLPGIYNYRVYLLLSPMLKVAFIFTFVTLFLSSSSDTTQLATRRWLTREKKLSVSLCISPIPEVAVNFFLK